MLAFDRLTSAQITDLAVKRGATRVVLLCRGQVKVKHCETQPSLPCDSLSLTRSSLIQSTLTSNGSASIKPWRRWRSGKKSAVTLVTTSSPKLAMVARRWPFFALAEFGADGPSLPQSQPSVPPHPQGARQGLPC